MSEFDPSRTVSDVSLPKRLGLAALKCLSAMGRGFEAQNMDNIGARTIAFDVMTGNLEQADAALRLTPVPDAPPKDLAIKN